MAVVYRIETQFLTQDSYGGTGTKIIGTVRDVKIENLEKVNAISQLRDEMQVVADELTDVVNAMGQLNIQLSVKQVEV